MSELEEPAPTSPQVVERPIGVDEHRAARQLLGGDFTSDPNLLAYVRRVGEKLARGADTQLPYAFTIVDNSLPSAWVLPGGQIIVSRGLLQNLRCESQLAGVLALQIARVPRDRTADPEQSEFVTQAARTAAQLSVVDNPFASLVVGEGALAANLLVEHDPASDEHAALQNAMRYLKQAGYDPAAAVDIQRMRLHTTPDRGEKRIAATSTGKVSGCKEYHAATRKVRQMTPAYQAYDAGIAALKQYDLATAEAEAGKARALAPDQAKTHLLLGDLAMERGKFDEALAHFQRSIELNPEYFEPYVSGGIAAQRLGDRETAAKRLNRSMALLPTAPAAFHLARISEESGDLAQAIQYYQLAASSDSEVGRDAARKLVVLDLPRNPARYVHAEPKIDTSTGKVWMEIRNEAPVAVDRIVVAAAVAKPEGGVAQGPVHVDTGTAPLAPGTTTRIATPLGPLARDDALQLVRTQVKAAEVAEPSTTSPAERDKPRDPVRTTSERLR